VASRSAGVSGTLIGKVRFLNARQKARLNHFRKFSHEVILAWAYAANEGRPSQFAFRGFAEGFAENWGKKRVESRGRLSRHSTAFPFVGGSARDDLARLPLCPVVGSLPPFQFEIEIIARFLCR